MATWRKSREGEWCVFGPVEVIARGSVMVTRRDGKVRMVTIARMSRPFDVRGQAFAYGYLTREAGQ